MEPDRDARLGVLMVAPGSPADSERRFPPPRVAGEGSYFARRSSCRYATGPVGVVFDHVDDRQGISAKHPRRPRHLCRQGARQGSDDASGLRQRRAHLCGAVRYEGRSRSPRRHDVRGGRRALQHVLPAAALAGGSPPPQPGAPQDRGFLLRLDGTHARRLRGQSHRAFDEARSVRQRARRPQEQSAGDLRARAAQRPVRDLCDRAAAGRAQQGLLPVQGTAAAGAAGDRRGRQGRHAQRHEDAGERRGLRPRGAGRQCDAACARPAQGIHHLRYSAEPAGPHAVVARAVQPAGHELLRPSAHHAIR